MNHITDEPWALLPEESILDLNYRVTMAGLRKNTGRSGLWVFITRLVTFHADTLTCLPHECLDEVELRFDVADILTFKTVASTTPLSTPCSRL